MGLEYNTDQRLKALFVVVDDYTQWCMQVMRRICYPAGSAQEAQFSRPVSYMSWAEEAAQEGFKSETLNAMNALHDDLSQQADEAVTNVMKTGHPASYEEFNKTLTLFEEFLYKARRLEQDLIIEDSGIDPVTGLRSHLALAGDVRREMDRLARQGRPFSVALIRIDHLEEMKSEGRKSDAEGLVRAVAEMIKRSMRSYDDAYRLESDEFVLSLKQASMSGAVRALERLKRELERSNVKFVHGGKAVALSLSSCIAEPVPGDDLQDLILNLRKDLDGTDKKDGTVLEYFEMSPLQRYAREFRE